MREEENIRGEDEVVRMWKEEYERIPVPEETEARVREGIRQARLEKKRRDQKKYIKRTGAAAAAALLVFGTAVNVSSVVANAMDGIPVIGGIAKVVTFRTYTDERDFSRADIQIPQLGKNAEANAEIMGYANSLIARYEAEVAEETGQYALESNYEVVSDHDDYVSIQINTVETQASGAEYLKIFTVDTQTGQTVSLSSVLKDEAALEAVSRNILEQMEEQMAEDSGKVYYTGEEPGDFQKLTGKENFYFNEKGSLVIVFGEYEVAPGYMGVVSFEIPDEISGVVA